jgi:hypothetical protein
LPYVVDHDAEDERDRDDWFAEPEPPPEESSLHRHADAAAAALDDWLQEPERVPRKLTHRLEKRRLAAAGAILCLLLLVGLVAGGVFSGRSATPPAPAGTSVTLSLPSASTAFVPPTPPLPAGTLKPGARGPQVIPLQRALARLGYYSGRIDGQYGPGTESAVSRFQAASALTPDGIFGPSTRRALQSALAR